MKYSQLVLLLAGLVLATAQSFGAPTVRFALPVPYTLGTDGTNAAVTADVNGDGFPDLIVTTNNGVDVLLNNGDGTFAALVNYPTGGTFSNSVAIADVDGDGNLDLIVTNMCLDPTVCSGVAVLTGLGDGTFNAPVGYDSGGLETGSVAVGDVNGDGAPDLVLTSNCQAHTCAGGTLSFLLNNNSGPGTKTFAKPVLLGISKGGPVAIADVNGDGSPDLVTGAGVFLGDGSGNFTPLDPPNVPPGALSIVVADFNGDGKLDLAATVATGVAVQLGNGDGTFQAARTYKTGGVTPLSVTAADLNGDGKLDLAVSNECNAFFKGFCGSESSVGVLAGNGDGTFKAAVPFHTGGTFATSVAAADVDGDTKIDLIVADACTFGGACGGPNGLVSVLLNNFMTTSATKVVTSLTPANPAQVVTFTATVTSSAAVPDGSNVIFRDGAIPFGTSPTAGGVASVMASFSLAGHHTITASFAGDVFHSPSLGTVAETINKYPSTTTVSSGPNPSTFKQAVTITATVTSAAAGGPTGIVKFYNGAIYLGSAPVGGGMATFITSTLASKALPVGTLTINANYQGDSQSAVSQGSTSQTVN